MKSLEQINHARKVVTKAISDNTKGELSEQQMILLFGMSTALQWVADAGGSSLQRLIDGEEIAYGQMLKFPDLRKTKHES
jgi:hypothetical protein